jgi:arsenite methyltransferase
MNPSAHAAAKTTPTAHNLESIDKYRKRAAQYDDSAAFTMPLRRRTIAQLRLQPGQVVLDVGSGTGLSYALLRDAVGEQGQVFGFEQSPEMFAQAATRVAAQGWHNLWHVQARAEDVQLPSPVDAVLFNYVHDISRTPHAVENIMRQVRPGSRVAMAGMKFFPWWTGPLNILAWIKNRPYNAKAADLWSPWDIVASYCDDFEWQPTMWGMGYVASGVRR